VNLNAQTVRAVEKQLCEDQVKDSVESSEDMRLWINQSIEQSDV
jgi:hypothetical protein